MEKIPEFILNHPYLFSLLLIILVLLFWSFYHDTLSGVKLLLPLEVTQMINHEDARVVDIRSQTDFEGGHIIGAINISADQLDAHLHKLKQYQDKGIILCCHSGATTSKRARKLINDGIKKVYCLKGGVFAWQNANLPLIKGLK